MQGQPTFPDHLVGHSLHLSTTLSFLLGSVKPEIKHSQYNHDQFVLLLIHVVSHCPPLEAYEVFMVGVNIGKVVLYHQQDLILDYLLILPDVLIYDRLTRIHQARIPLHLIIDDTVNIMNRKTGLQLREESENKNLLGTFAHSVSEFLNDKVHNLERGCLQSLNLPLQGDLKCQVRSKQPSPVNVSSMNTVTIGTSP